MSSSVCSVHSSVSHDVSNYFSLFLRKSFAIARKSTILAFNYNCKIHLYVHDALWPWNVLISLCGTAEATNQRQAMNQSNQKCVHAALVNKLKVCWLEVEARLGFFVWFSLVWPLGRPRRGLMCIFCCSASVLMLDSPTVLWLYICLATWFSFSFRVISPPRTTAASFCREQNRSTIEGLIFFFLIVQLFNLFGQSDT